MAVTGEQVKITVRYTWLEQECENIHYFGVTGGAWLTVDMIQALTAFWDDIEEDLRACMPSGGNGLFTSVFGEEIGGMGGYAEYPVPSDMNTGTRITSSSAGVTGTLAVGFRQTVGTHATRPGQKRYPFVLESDLEGNAFVAGGSLLTAIDTWAGHICSEIVLGAPAATCQLHPLVGGSAVAGVPTVWQDVTGYIVNPYVTSQVSRKRGRGR